MEFMLEIQIKLTNSRFNFRNFKKTITIKLERPILPKFKWTRKDNPRKTRIQFGNTKILYVQIRQNQENIQETFDQP
jgi:hypothetical protein